MRPRRKRYNLADSSSEHQPPAPPGAVLRAAALARAKKTVPTVKLHAASPAFYNTFTAYGADYVEINQVRHGSSVLVMPEGPVLSWPVLRFADLAAEHFAAVLAQGPEVVVLGTGLVLRFPPGRILRALTERHIGVECMDVHAACRTYNILMTEGRRVAAALLIETPAAGR